MIIKYKHKSIEFVCKSWNFDAIETQICKIRLFYIVVIAVPLNFVETGADQNEATHNRRQFVCVANLA